MMKSSRNWIFGTGFALILAANAVVLATVAYNRSGEPESQLKLTERELLPLYGARPSWEASGLDLDLQWRVLPRDPKLEYWGGTGGGSPVWLDRAKLASLGFDVTPPRDTPDGLRHYERLLPREVLVVLELDGPSYQEALKRAQQRADAEAKRLAANPPDARGASRGNPAAEQLKREQVQMSRLFAVDAGLEASALREKYADRSRYAIVRGKVSIDLSRYRHEAAPLHGYVSAIGNTRINVPVQLHGVIGSAVTRDRHTEARPMPGIDVEIAFGKRFEPWIVAASARQPMPPDK